MFDAGVGAYAVELQGYEHVELVTALFAVALHGVIDGDDSGRD